MFRKSFRKIFRLEKPRIYLGTLAVAPRTDLKRHFDQWGAPGTEEPDTQMRQMLEEIFALPRPDDIVDPKSSDLVLDVIIPKFQSGAFFGLDVGAYWFPLLWRPKVSVTSRLYYLKSGKTAATFHLTQKMAWREYLKGILRLQSILQLDVPFGRNDMERLLTQACLKILVKMNNSL